MPSQSVVPGPASSPSPNTSRPRWQSRRVWAGTAAALVLVAGIAVVQRQRSSGRANLAPYTVIAESGNLPGVVSASGELEAEKRVNVSPKRQGVIEELYVEEGDPVRRGQALARMDRGDLDDRLGELQAQLRSAQAQLARSRSELERNERLYRQNAISLSDYNTERSTFLVDQAAEQAARQRLEARQVEQADLIVRAPFDGVVTQRFADPGQRNGLVLVCLLPDLVDQELEIIQGHGRLLARHVLNLAHRAPVITDRRWLDPDLVALRNHFSVSN